MFILIYGSYMTFSCSYNVYLNGEQIGDITFRANEEGDHGVFMLGGGSPDAVSSETIARFMRINGDLRTKVSSPQNLRIGTNVIRLAMTATGEVYAFPFGSVIVADNATADDYYRPITHMNEWFNTGAGSACFRFEYDPSRTKDDDPPPRDAWDC